MPSRPDPRDTLLSYLRVQKGHDRRLYALLNRAAADIDRDVRALAAREGIGAQVRRDQLLLAKRTILLRLSRMMQDAGYLIQSERLKSAAAGVASMKVYDRVLMSSVKDDALVAHYLRSAEVQSQRGIDSAVQRLLGTSYRPLAESVYLTDKLNAGTVDRYVESALARGLSAREFARGAVDLVKPSVPGGVSYATMRLGRTEINNAFHASAAERARKAPWIDAVRWNLSGSHPKPDECNDYADSEHFEGGDPGLYLPDDVPAKPHPQCLCFITPEVVEEDAWLDAYFRGDYDDFMRSVGSGRSTLAEAG